MDLCQNYVSPIIRLINMELAEHTKGISLNCGFRWLRKVSKMLCMKMLDLVKREIGSLPRLVLFVQLQELTPNSQGNNGSTFYKLKNMTIFLLLSAVPPFFF